MRPHLDFSHSRVAVAVLAALALSWILLTHVVLEFRPVRMKLLRAPAVPTNGVVQVDVPSGHPVLDAPFAVISRIRNESSRRLAFEIRADGRSLCTREIPGEGTSRRIDCVTTVNAGRWIPEARHRLEVIGGTGGEWSLDYLEIATHHGSTRGRDLIIVPATARRGAHPGPLYAMTSFLLIVAAFLLPSPDPAWVRGLHLGVSGLVAGVMLLVGLSSFVSSYSVLLSPRAFFGMTLVLVAPRLWRAGTWLWSRRAQRWGRALIYAAVGAGVLAAYGSVAAQLLHDFGGNYSGFVRVSRERFDKHPRLSGREDVRRALILYDGTGYDGQFVYFLAFDPLLLEYRHAPATYRGFIDAPPYRCGRIGFSMMTWLFSAGHWPRFPMTMVWLILASLLASAFLLAALADRTNARFLGLLIAIVPGFWQSLGVALPEPVAAALLLGGCLLIRRRRIGAAGVLFAASMLVRETGAILAGASAIGLLASGYRRDGVRLLAISFAPLLVWRVYAGVMLFPDWGAQAFLFNAHNVGMPFGGIFELWQRIQDATYHVGSPTLARAGVLYPILVCCGLGVGAVAVAIRPGPASVSAVLYGLIAISFTYGSIWVHVGNAQRGSYELFIALALVFIGTDRSSRGLWWAPVTFWTSAAFYVFFGGFDADFIRNAIL